MLNVTWTEVNTASSSGGHSRAMRNGPLWSKVLEMAEAKAPGRPQVWLADGLQVSLQTVNNWKTRGVPAGYSQRLAALLGCTVDQLLTDSWAPELAPQPTATDAESRERMLSDLMGWLPSLDPVLLRLTYAAVKNAVLSRPQ
jgi:hypothetical protein